MDHQSQKRSQKDDSSKHIKFVHVFRDDGPEYFTSQLKLQGKSQNFGQFQLDLPSLCGKSCPEILEKSFDTAKDDDKDPEKFQEVDAEHHSFC